MEGKSMVKLSHLVAFLLLASMFRPLMARYVSDKIEVLLFPAAKENQEKLGAPDFCHGKSSWPELVGKPASVATETIVQENSDALVAVVPSDESVGSSICGRVFVFIDHNYNVNRIPKMQLCCLEI